MTSVKPFLAFALALSSATAALAQEKVAPKTQALIDGLVKALPEYEKAADQIEEALQPFRKSTDDNVAVAVDSARLQILSIRSVRKIIAEQPSYLLHHVSPANLPLSSARPMTRSAPGTLPRKT
jgi:hypothetical protein